MIESAFHTRVFKPAESLRSCIVQYSMMDIHAEEFDRIKVKAFPTALAGVGICLYGSKLKFWNDRSNTGCDYSSSVVGIYPIETDNYLSPVQSDSHLVTIMLTHEGINRLLGLPVLELFNTHIPLDYLYGGELGTLIDQLENAEKDMDKVACLDNFFIRKLQRGHSADHRRIFRVMDILNSSRSMISVQELASEMNVHTRTLERIFVTNIGLTPKELLRIRRFILLKDYLVGNPAIHWSDLIFKCGFYDQAHLIHEITKVTNMSPSDFFRMARTLN